MFIDPLVSPQIAASILAIVIVICAFELTRCLWRVRPIQLPLMLDCAAPLITWLVGGLTLTSEIGWLCLWSLVSFVTFLWARNLLQQSPIADRRCRILQLVDAGLTGATVLLIFRKSDADATYLISQTIFILVGVVILVQAVRLIQESIDKHEQKRRLAESYRYYPTAGWYQNPDNPTELRWFNGVEWTDETAPK